MSHSTSTLLLHQCWNSYTACRITWKQLYCIKTSGPLKLKPSMSTRALSLLRVTHQSSPTQTLHWDVHEDGREVQTWRTSLGLIRNVERLECIFLFSLLSLLFICTHVHTHTHSPAAHVSPSLSILHLTTIHYHSWLRPSFTRRHLTTPSPPQTHW